MDSPITSTIAVPPTNGLPTLYGTPQLPPFEHPMYTTQQLHQAKVAFLRYGAQSESFPQSDPNVVSTASLFDPPGIATLSLNLAGVQLVLRSFGIRKADSEAKDMIFQLNQSAAVTQHNKQHDKKMNAPSVGTVPLSTARSAPEAAHLTPLADSVLQPKSVRSVSNAGSVTAASSTGQQSSQAMFRVTFPVFLELLTMTHHVDVTHGSHATGPAGVRLSAAGGTGAAGGLTTPLPTPQEELEAVFRMLDSDGDGMVSTADLKAVIALLGKTLGTVNRDVQAALLWNDVQIQTILREADLDCNGQVTFDDFQKAVQSA